MGRYGVLLAVAALSAAAISLCSGCGTPTPAAPAAASSTATGNTGDPITGTTTEAAAPTVTGTTPATRTPPATPTTVSPTTVSPTVGPPYIASTRWVRTSSGRSLHIVPTRAGRDTSGPSAAAWAEVLRLTPDADTPGMRAQFDCHWTFARLVAPDKPSWNIEPWRPVVSGERLARARCNPGGGDEG